MPRVDDYLDLVDDPARRALTPGDPADDALLALLAHVAFSDRELDPGELAFLGRVLPGREEADIRDWVRGAGSRPLDLQQVAGALPTVEERWKGLRFAVRMAWKDGVVQDEERTLLQKLVWALELPEGALDRVIDEVQAQVQGQVTADKLSRALQRTPWGAVQLADGGCRQKLKLTTPEGWSGVARVGLERHEVIGFYVEGLVAQFLEGPVALRWSDIVAYTRVPTLGAAVQLHTEDGRTLTLVDHRLRGLVALLDRLFREPGKATVPPPAVRQVRGSGTPIPAELRKKLDE